MDHEILAIMEALQHWQPYLHGKKFVVCIWTITPLCTSLHNQIFPLV